MKKYINFIYFFSFLFTLTITSFADNAKKDSLKNALVSVTSDSIKINILNELAVEYMKVSPDFSDSLLTIAQLLAEKSNNYIYIAKTYFNIGLLNRYQSNYYKANEFTKMAQKIFVKNKNQKGIAQCLGSIGVIHMEQAEYPMALDNYFNSLKIYDEQNDKKGIAYTYGNIGNVYYLQGNFDRAIDYFSRSLEIYKSLGQMSGISKICNLLGAVYNKKGLFDDASKYYNMSLTICKQLNDKHGIAYCYEYIAESFLVQGNFEKALELNQQSLALREELGNKSGVAKNLFSIGKLQLLKNENIKAIQYFNKSLEIAKELNSLELMKSNYEYLSTIYNGMSDYKKAYEYLSLNRIISDSIFNIEKSKQFSQLEMNYMFEKKKHQMELKQKQKEALELIEHNKLRIIRNVFIIGFFVLLLLAFILYRNYKGKMRANKLLLVKNMEIELQKEEIMSQSENLKDTNNILQDTNTKLTDSIYYAQKIQEAILTPSCIIKQYFPESFIIYLPRDIVSGDFYWISKENNLIFIICADCTGHGVPGALMSMIGNTLLNEIIITKDIHSPSKILEEMNHSINHSINRETDLTQSQDDGMDMSICCIDTEKKIITVAAAYHHMIVIQDDKMQIITGAIHSVGGLLSGRVQPTYDEVILPLKKDTVFYLFSDGFYDQFNPVSTKMGFDDFSRALYKNHKMPMADQKINLLEKFKEWKGSFSQLDDILVMGFNLNNWM